MVLNCENEGFSFIVDQNETHTSAVANTTVQATSNEVSLFVNWTIK